MKHDEPSRGELIAHHAHRIAVTAGFGMIVTQLAYALLGFGDFIFPVTSAACMIVFVLGITISARHHPGTCLKCLADFPLEHVEVVVERHLPSLRGFHVLVRCLVAVAKELLHVWMMIRRGKGRTSYTLSLSTVMLIAVVPLIIATYFVPPPWGSIGLMTATMWFIIVSGRHQRLAPWCPWCRDNGDNDDDDEEIPDPDPATGKKINV